MRCCPACCISCCLMCMLFPLYKSLLPSGTQTTCHCTDNCIVQQSHASQSSNVLRSSPSVHAGHGMQTILTRQESEHTSSAATAQAAVQHPRSSSSSSSRNSVAAAIQQQPQSAAASAAPSPDHADRSICDVNGPELPRGQAQRCAQQRAQQALVRYNKVAAARRRQQVCWCFGGVHFASVRVTSVCFTSSGRRSG